MSVPETADRAGSAEVFQLLLGVNRVEKNHLCPLAYLVGDGTLQPVLLPLPLRHSHHAEEAGVSAGRPTAPLLPAEAGGEAGQEGRQAALGGGAGGEGGDLVVTLLTEDGQSSGEVAPHSRLVEPEVEAGAA